MTFPTEEVQKLSLDPDVVLFEIDATNIGGEIYRLAPAPLIADLSDPVPQAVTWGGNIYSPIRMESTGWQMTGKGTLPSPNLKVANIQLQFSALAIAFRDLLGCQVTRRRTFRRYLDGQPDADPDIEFDPDIFQIEQKIAQNKVYVEWRLGPAIDVEGRLLPGRQITQGFCPLRYRFWDADAVAFDYSQATCPFTGDTNDDKMFDNEGVEVFDPALDRCAKRVNIGCKKRFPSQPLPFGGFPGVNRVRL
jgi:lambda family phage minor tail protein L